MVVEKIREDWPELLLMDGFDDCIVGVASQFHNTAVAYDEDQVIQKLMDQRGMDKIEAIEYMEYNQKGAWVGESTPIFVKDMRNDRDE
tara:strand:- start:3429 stop:3692 length:264 start_codon:yes stop_codon:yes gene_type:complete